MSEYRNWKEKVLPVNHRFVLVWDEGATFHRVIGVEHTQQIGFVESAAITSAMMPAGAVDDPSNRSSVVIRDTDGNYSEDVTTVYPNIIYQIFYGFSPSWIRVFPSYPADRRRGKILSYPSPTPDSRYGFFTGEDSPAEDPTEIAEFWFPLRMRIMFDFANPRVDRRAHPSINLRIVKYRVEHFDPRDPGDAGIISQMARGTSPAYWYTLGPAEAPKSFDLVSHWNVRPIPIAQAKSLGEMVSAPRRR